MLAATRKDIAGFPVLDVSSRALCAELDNRLESGQPAVLFFANANFVVKCRDLLDWIRKAPVLIANDGVAMDGAAKFVYGQPFQENLNGTDFTPQLLASLSFPKRVFLLGGRPGVAERAGEVIRARYGHEIVGCADGYGDLADPALCARINSLRTDIVLVALGNPRQEQWIARHHALLDAGLVMAIGALFDFMSGNIQRAPMWVQRIRCEWLYRLFLEPRRLLRRYTIDTMHFFYLVVRQGRASRS
ncbi:MAG: WecB/TagA/CpsF family glycosyltransferase [Moraxellaceae bacterium]|nr:WecB/TagA/CpsF family glycosyltransferase [Moraxellaceae bacterium]